MPCKNCTCDDDLPEVVVLPAELAAVCRAIAAANSGFIAEVQPAEEPRKSGTVSTARQTLVKDRGIRITHPPDVTDTLTPPARKNEESAR